MCLGQSSKPEAESLAGKVGLGIYHDLGTRCWLKCSSIIGYPTSLQHSISINNGVEVL
jgi:hypothetical protein